MLADVGDTTPEVNVTPKYHEHRQDNRWTTLQVPVRFSYCAVISNCCDLEPRDGRVLVHAIAMARLRPIPPDIRNDQRRLDSLIANKDPRDPDDPGYIDYFYVAPHEQLSNADWMVSFHQIVSVPSTDSNLLLARRVVQLNDRARMKFKIKLAFSFGRSNDEELEAGLGNPWNEAPAQG